MLSCSHSKMRSQRRGLVALDPGLSNPGCIPGQPTSSSPTSMALRSRSPGLPLPFCWTRSTPTHESPALGLSSVVPSAPSPAAWHRGGNSSGTLGAVCVVWQRHPMSTVEHGRLPCALEHDPGGRERRAPGRSLPWTDVLPSLGVVGPHHGSLGTSCAPGRGPVHMLCGWAILQSGSWWAPQCGR